MKNLKRYRTASGMSQAQLSNASGVSLRSIQCYEQGVKDINRAEGLSLYKLSKALGCRMEQLLELEVLQPPMTITQALFLFAEHLPRYADQCLEIIRHIELGDKELFSQNGVQFIAAHLDEDPDFPVEVQQQLRRVIDLWTEEHAAHKKGSKNMESKKVWYAVMKDNEDTDHGYGSHDLEKAIEMATRMRKSGDEEAYIAVIDPEDDYCIDEIRDF